MQIEKAIIFSVLQIKQQEINRTEKWVKMLKNWDKYRNSEKVRRHLGPELLIQ